MNRKEIKEQAKAKIKGAKWDIIWPALIISVISSVLTRIFGGTVNIDLAHMTSISDIQASPRVYVGSMVVSLAVGIITAGYIKYILNFVRTGKFNTDDIINTIKEKWVNVLIASVLVSVIVFACSLLLVIPGIIMALAYTFVIYLVVDTDIAGNDALKAGREMMHGYKWDYFVFELSFIGWIILIPFTLGLILIWLYPYMTIANTLYYENLKKIRAKK